MTINNGNYYALINIGNDWFESNDKSINKSNYFEFKIFVFLLINEKK